MVKKKGKSKRVSLKQKYKVERRVKEHKKKEKKLANRKAGAEAKKRQLDPLSKGKKKAKVPEARIPNSWPFKEELVQQLAVSKRKQEARLLAEKEAKREARLAARAAARGEAAGPASLASLVQSAAERVFDDSDDEGAAAADGDARDAAHRQAGEQSRRAYLATLRKVIEQSDVLLEVLDARDPEGCRARVLENAVSGRADKKVVLVLNKVDLVPRDAAVAWLKRLRREFPTVAIKANTQSGQQKHLGQSSAGRGDAANASESALKGSSAVGTASLLKLLKNYCRPQGQGAAGVKTSITVGIVGLPNVGKSSLVNSLTRQRTAGVSSTAGFTTAMQTVQLDKHLQLLDCPGVVLEEDERHRGDALAGEASAALRNAVDPKTLEDPVGVVNALLARCDADALSERYGIVGGKNVGAAKGQGVTGDVGTRFLVQLAHKKGHVKKGGVPDLPRAARFVVEDWNAGRIPFFTMPPADEELGDDEQALMDSEVSLLPGYGDSFDVAAMTADDVQVLKNTHSGAGFVAITSSAVPADSDDDMESGDESQDDGDSDEMSE